MRGTVTVPNIGKRLKLRLAELTPAEMAEVYRTGHARDLLTIGDQTALVPLVGTIAGTAFNTAVTYRLVHIDEQGLVFILACNANGVEIALADSKYNTRPASTVDCIRFKATETTVGGYGASLLNTKACPDIYNALPAEWRNVIRKSRVWADNKGNGDLTAQALTVFEAFVFVPDQQEYGTLKHVDNCNPHNAVFIGNWEWYAEGNPVEARRIDAPTQPCYVLTRTPATDKVSVIVGTPADGYTLCYADRGSGLKYAFRIA